MCIVLLAILYIYAFVYKLMGRNGFLHEISIQNKYIKTVDFLI